MPLMFDVFEEVLAADPDHRAVANRHSGQHARIKPDPDIVSDADRSCGRVRVGQAQGPAGDALEFRHQDAVVARFTPAAAPLRAQWLEHVAAIFAEATLVMPSPDAWMQKGGKQGEEQGIFCGVF
mgnify:CR=1 FL=1